MHNMAVWTCGLRLVTSDEVWVKTLVICNVQAGVGIEVFDAEAIATMPCVSTWTAWQNQGHESNEKSPVSLSTYGAFLLKLLAETEGFEPSIQVLAQMLP
jgi:hypothetical protein